MLSLPDYPSQWQCLLQNLGQWRGTFTDISPAGEWGPSRPSTVTLEGLEENRTIRQTITVDGMTKVLTYSGLGRGILLFTDGAFSQGSMQWGPFGDFGAELGLINGEQRVRCAIVYHDSQCHSLTLMHEQRGQGQLGNNHRNKITQLYPDWRTPMELSGYLTVQCQVHQVSIQWALATASWAWCGGSHGQNVYEHEMYRALNLTPDIWVWFPPVVPKGEAFHLGLIWQKQALLRRYDQRGAWVDLTQVQGVLVADSPAS